MKYLAEKELQASGLMWTVIQATAFMETWGEIIGRPLLKTGKAIVFGHGNNPINFVSIYDVEQFVEMALVTNAMDKTIIEVGGPQNLSMRQVVKIFEVDDREERCSKCDSTSDDAFDVGANAPD